MQKLHFFIRTFLSIFHENFKEIFKKLINSGTGSASEE